MAFDKTKYVDANGNPTDTTLVQFAQALRKQESGGDPTKLGDNATSAGAYQWNNGKAPLKPGQAPVNFQNGAKQFGLDPSDFSLENQNKVAYLQMAEDKDSGLQPYEIAAKWNSGSPKNWQNHSGDVVINGKTVHYDTPAYVRNVMSNFTSLRADSSGAQQEMGGAAATPAAPTPSPSQQADTASAQQTGALFPSSTSDNGLTAGFKTAGNLIPSAFNFAKGALNSINPLNIAKNIAQIPGAFSSLVQESGGVGNALKSFGSELLPTAYDQLVPAFGKDLGNAGMGLITGNQGRIDAGLSSAQRDVTNDPVGSIAPFVFAAEGGAKVADNIATRGETSAFRSSAGDAGTVEGPVRPVTAASDLLDKTMSTIAKPVTAPISAAASAVSKAVPAVTRYAFGQATGLEPNTITTVADNPSQFSPANKGAITRPALGDTIKSGLDERISNLSDTGAAYNEFRQSDTPVKVDPAFLKDMLERSAGVTFEDSAPKAAKPLEAGELPTIQVGDAPASMTKQVIKATGDSSVRDTADVSKLQKLYDFWQPYFEKGEMTPAEFLNMREDLAKMANYEGGFGKSKPLDNVGASVRSAMNDQYRSQIKGLDLKDADYSSQITELKNLRKGILDKNNELTDGAVNKISNAAGKGKDQLLARLEEISPGITKQIQILKAAEDIERAAGNKVGTYTRSTLGTGGLIAGVVTANIPVIAASVAEMIISNPEVSTRIIRAYGASKPLMKAIAEKLRGAASTVNNLPESGGAALNASTVFGRPTPSPIQSPAIPQLTQ